MNKFSVISSAERRRAVETFVDRWKNGGDEIKDTQIFWNDFF